MSIHLGLSVGEVEINEDQSLCPCINNSRNVDIVSSVILITKRSYHRLKVTSNKLQTAVILCERFVECSAYYVSIYHHLNHSSVPQNSSHRLSAPILSVSLSHLSPFLSTHSPCLSPLFSLYQTTYTCSFPHFLITCLLTIILPFFDMD